MKDVFGRGIIAGIVGIVAINLVEVLLAFLNISETPLWQAGGIVFLSEQALQTPLGIAIGVFSHVFIGIVVAIAISYFIHATGSNLATLKGIGLSLVVGFITLALIFPLRGVATEMQNSPGDVLAAFIDHTVFGALAGYLIGMYQTDKSGQKTGQLHQETLHVPQKFIVKKTLRFKKPKKI